MSTTMAAWEHMFITPDGDQVFKMIEDESGDIYWGYGHREAGEFIAEINRWAIHTGEIDPDMSIPDDHLVEHLWATPEDSECERFKLVSRPWLGTKADADKVFPVTRLML